MQNKQLGLKKVLLFLKGQKELGDIEELDYPFLDPKTVDAEKKAITHLIKEGALELKGKVEKPIFYKFNSVKLKIISPNFDIFCAGIIPSQAIVRKIKHPDWNWYDREKGIFDFGTVRYQQGGKIYRKKVFQEAMDLYLSSEKILIKVLHEKTGFDLARLRKELHAINVHLASKNIRYFFKGSRQGFYSLEPALKKEIRLDLTSVTLKG